MPNFLATTVSLAVPRRRIIFGVHSIGSTGGRKALIPRRFRSLATASAEIPARLAISRSGSLPSRATSFWGHRNRSFTGARLTAMRGFPRRARRNAGMPRDFRFLRITFSETPKRFAMLRSVS